MQEVVTLHKETDGAVHTLIMRMFYHRQAVSVIPAQAGIRGFSGYFWIPVFTGMTN
jgi:hypothetical protein